jgi:hypothetical protein
MMGLLKKDQGQLFYEFHLGDAVLKIIRYGRLTPLSTCLRPVLASLELAAHYSSMGRSCRIVGAGN